MSRNSIAAALLTAVAALASCSDGEASPRASESSNQPRSPAQSPSPNAPAEPQDIARAYLELRAGQVLLKPPDTDLRGIPMTERLRLTYLRDVKVLRARAKDIKERGDGYTRATVRIIRPKLQAKGGGARLRAREDTDLFYADPTGGTPPKETYHVWHTFTFVKQGGRWLLDKDVPVNADVPPITVVRGS